MAKEWLQFAIGKGLSEEGILEALSGYSDELLGFLVENLGRLSQRAEYSPETFKLVSVYKLGRSGQYSLCYEYGWSAYYGCKDMNDGGVAQEEAVFKYRGGIARFSKEVSERRHTFEEF